VWTNCTTPICYRGDHAIADISEIKKTDNIRGAEGPVQIFINSIATFKGSPITEVYTNVSTGVLNYLITDWHAIASFSFYDPGVLNYYIDAYCGHGAYCLMSNSDIWSKIEKAGYADAIESVSGDYLTQLVPIWNYWEALGRYDATTTGGVIYDPSEKFAAELQDAYDAAATQWISDTVKNYGYDQATVQALYDRVAELVEKYNAMYG
jgi:TRAP-type C4-dicarboxylate transport system substrate-binding protein